MTPRDTLARLRHQLAGCQPGPIPVTPDLQRSLAEGWDDLDGDYGEKKGRRKGAAMISDVLHEAIAEIERYQRSFPKCYDELRVEIGKATAVMDALQTRLDCPPTKGRYPRYEAALGRLGAEIARLDVEPLLRAMDDLKAAWPTPEEVEEANMQTGAAPGTHQKQNQAADGQHR